MRTIYMNEVLSTHQVGEKWDIQLLKGGREARVTGRRGNTWENPIQCHMTAQNGTLFMQGDDIPQYVVKKVKILFRTYG